MTNNKSTHWTLLHHGVIAADTKRVCTVHHVQSCSEAVLTVCYIVLAASLRSGLMQVNHIQNRFFFFSQIQFLKAHCPQRFQPMSKWDVALFWLVYWLRTLSRLVWILQWRDMVSLCHWLWQKPWSLTWMEPLSPHALMSQWGSSVQGLLVSPASVCSVALRHHTPNGAL